MHELGVQVIIRSLIRALKVQSRIFAQLVGKL